MSYPSDQPPRRIREEDVHKLIARAIELDRQNADGLTLEQVRHVAAESGISSEAFETALQESGYQAAPVTREPQLAEAPGWLRYAIVFAIVLLAIVALLEL